MNGKGGRRFGVDGERTACEFCIGAAFEYPPRISFRSDYTKELESRQKLDHS